MYEATLARLWPAWQTCCMGQFRRGLLFEFLTRAEALDSLDQARSDTEPYKNRFSMQGGSSNLSLDEHKSRARESFARLQVRRNFVAGAGSEKTLPVCSFPSLCKMP